MLGRIWQSRVMRDARLAFRMLRRNPGFAIAAVLTLAIGIGATTVLFSLVDAVLLRPLPYADASRLVEVWSAMPGRGIAKSTSSMPDYETWVEQTRMLEAAGAYKTTAFNLSGLDAPKRVRAAEITPSVLRVLQMRPRLGDWFADAAANWGQHREVLLSDGFWRSGLGADEQAVGRTVLLDGESYRVAGVMPPSFEFPDASTDVWVPLSFPPNSPLRTRQNYPLWLVGRLKPGTTPLQAQAELSSIVRAVNPQVEASVIDLHEAVVGDVRPTLLLLLGAVAFVLLLACANVANLTVVRNMGRQRELMLRTALGASRGRIVQQVLTESLVIAVIGGVLGVSAAAVGLRAVEWWAPASVPRLGEVAINLRVLAITLLVSAAAGVIAGVLPALTVSRVDVAEALKASARGNSAGRRDAWVRGLLVGSEVCLAVILLIGASLMIVTVVKLQFADLGFRSPQVMTFQLDLPESRYQDPPRVAAFVDQAVDRLRALPGVEAVGVTSALPLLDTAGLSALFSIDGRPVTTMAEVPVVGYRQTTADYFRALGVTLARGRVFSDRDQSGAPLVAIVNDTLARRFWPGTDAVGQTFHLGPPETLIGMRPGTFPRVTIVGVIRDIRQEGHEHAVKPELFVPLSQAGRMTQRSLRVAARVKDAVGNHGAEVQSAITQLDRSLAVSDVRSMDERLRVFLARRRFTVSLLGLFAGVALVMATIGIYGVMAYVAGERTSELGIRLALGAQKRGVIALVIAQNFRPTLIGAIAGLLAAWALSGVIRNQLFDVDPSSPLIYLTIAALMLVTGLLASYIPVRHIVAADPMRALRDAGDR